MGMSESPQSLNPQPRLALGPNPPQPVTPCQLRTSTPPPRPAPSSQLPALLSRPHGMCFNQDSVSLPLGLPAELPETWWAQAGGNREATGFPEGREQRVPSREQEVAGLSWGALNLGPVGSECLRLSELRAPFSVNGNAEKLFREAKEGEGLVQGHTVCTAELGQSSVVLQPRRACAPAPTARRFIVTPGHPPSHAVASAAGQPKIFTPSAEGREGASGVQGKRA